MKTIVFYSSTLRAVRCRYGLLLGMVLMLAVVRNTHANDLPKTTANIVKTSVEKLSDSMRLRVVAVPVVEGRFSIRLVNEKNDVFYYNSFNNSGYIRVFNLAELPDGNYQFIIAGKKYVSRHPFVIQTQESQTIRTPFGIR